MISLRNIKIKSVLLHLVFWVAVWFFFAYFFSYNSNDKVYIVGFASMVLPVTMIVTYFMIYYLIPKYLLTKNYLKFVLNCFYTFVFSTNIIVPLIFFSYVHLSNYNVDHMPLMSKNVVFILIMMYLIVGLVSFIRLLQNSYQTNSQNKELQHKILETQLRLKEQELQYLKMQIHPHFLFNTLNTLYGLALKQSNHTPDLILRLSNLLDYILYKVKKPLVELREEVEHIKEYIELEKIRFQDTLNVTILTENIEDDIKIAPMLLLPFVENAFKHGGIQKGTLHINIIIKNMEGELKFEISNTVKNRGTQVSKEGIGLENIKKRLEMHYHENYSLEYGISDQKFKVNLNINLLIKPDNV